MSDSIPEDVGSSDERTLTELKPVKTPPETHSMGGDRLLDVEQKEQDFTKVLQQIAIEVTAGELAGPPLDEFFGTYVRAIEIFKDINAMKKKEDTRASVAIVQAYRDLDRDGIYLQKRIESINMELSNEHYPCPAGKEPILRSKLAALSERLEHHKQEWDHVPEEVRLLEDEKKKRKKELADLANFFEDYISDVTRVLDRFLAKTKVEEANGHFTMDPVVHDRLLELRSQGQLD